MPSTNNTLCMYCAADMHFLCAHLEDIDDICCCQGNATVPMNKDLNLSDRADDITIKRPVGRPKKEEGYINQLAAGRKYAARHFPIAEGKICEWAWSTNAGGGAIPIMGCSGRPATNIHHGPDKSTLNNDRETNISQICAFCHNLWHAKNDPLYEGNRPEDGKPWLPSGECHALSEIEPADIDDILIHEAEYDRPMEGFKLRREVEEALRERIKTAIIQSNDIKTGA